MKILIASEGPNLYDKVAETFVDANFYILVEDETNKFQIIKNKEPKDYRKIIVDSINEDVQAFISGDIGPNAFGLMCKNNKKAILAKNRTVSEAYNMVLHGELKILECPTQEEDLVKEEAENS